MRVMFFTAVGFIMLGAMTLAQNVTYDFDAGADFSKFKTYTWVRGNQVPDELNHRRVVQSIDAQLVSKGLSQINANANPDILVAYHASFDTDPQISGFSTGFGGYRWGGNRSGVARAEEVLIGTLAVDIVDAKSKTIVWRAMATRDINVNAKPEKRAEEIQEA